MSETLQLRGTLIGHNGWVTQIATNPKDPDTIISASRGKYAVPCKQHNLKWQTSICGIIAICLISRHPGISFNFLNFFCLQTRPWLSGSWLVMTTPTTVSLRSVCTVTLTSLVMSFCLRMATTLCPAHGTKLCACGIWQLARPLAVSKITPRWGEKCAFLRKMGGRYCEES